MIVVEKFRNQYDRVNWRLAFVASPTDEENFAQLMIELARHDWFYEMSDDARVYRAGSAHWRRIDDLMKSLPDAAVAAAVHLVKMPQEKQDFLRKNRFERLPDPPAESERTMGGTS